MIETADDAIEYMKRHDGKALVISEAICARVLIEEVKELRERLHRLIDGDDLPELVEPTDPWSWVEDLEI